MERRIQHDPPVVRPGRAPAFPSGGRGGGMPGVTPRPRILLVDDDPAVRSSIAFALEVEGFEVGSYASAEAALAWAPLDGEACLVLDHRLPGMDGLALLRDLRARGVATPAIVITTNPNARLRALVAQQGAVLLEKPLLGNALASAIRALAAPAESSPQ